MICLAEHRIIAFSRTQWYFTYSLLTAFGHLATESERVVGLFFVGLDINIMIIIIQKFSVFAYLKHTCIISWWTWKHVIHWLQVLISPLTLSTPNLFFYKTLTANFDDCCFVKFSICWPESHYSFPLLHFFIIVRVKVLNLPFIEHSYNWIILVLN